MSRRVGFRDVVDQNSTQRFQTLVIKNVKLLQVVC